MEFSKTRIDEFDPINIVTVDEYTLCVDGITFNDSHKISSVVNGRFVHTEQGNCIGTFKILDRNGEEHFFCHLPYHQLDYFLENIRKGLETIESRYGLPEETPVE